MPAHGRVPSGSALLQRGEASREGVTVVPDESPAVLPDQHPGGIAPDPLDAAGTTADRGQAATPADVAEADPCAAEARIAEERCALADRLRALLDVAQTELRLAQRAFDLHERQLDRAIATAEYFFLTLLADHFSQC